MGERLGIRDVKSSVLGEGLEDRDEPATIASATAFPINPLGLGRDELGAPRLFGFGVNELFIGTYRLKTKQNRYDE